MSNKIVLKTGNTIPTSGDLEVGELGYSQGTNNLYTKDSFGNIISPKGVTVTATYPASVASVTISDNRILANSIILIGLQVTHTPAQAKAWGAANFQGTSQSNGELTLVPRGKVPVIPIPYQYTIM